MRVPAYLPKPVEILIYNWQQRLQTKGSLYPSLTIAQGQNTGYGGLRAECTECGHRGEVPFHKTRRPSSTPIVNLLQALVCTSCRKKGPPAARILGLAAPQFNISVDGPDECDHEEAVVELTSELNSDELDQEP